MNSHILGQSAELEIVNLLQSQDFIILEQNYKKFFGEIDIIAQKNDLIIFVEVKARTNPKTSMLELVPQSKQKKIKQTANAYIAKNSKKVSYRFDVALVQYCKEDNPQITYIAHAFM